MLNLVGEPAKKSEVAQELIALAIFDVLEKPLTAVEIRRYGWRAELNLSDVRLLAEPYRLVGDGQVRYGLSSSHVARAEKAEQLMGEYWSWVWKNRWLLTWVPFVKTVVVMNSLAWQNLHASSDIDLLVVTEPGRLWLARGWMLVLLKVFGRRAWGGDRAKKFAPEFFVDSNHLDLSDLGSRSLYLKAVWVADMVPIMYKGWFEKFWQANQWLAEYMPVAYRMPRQALGESLRDCSKNWLARLAERVLGGRWGDVLERQARERQEKMIARSVERLGEHPTVLTTNYICKAYFRDTKPERVDEAVERFLAG